MKRCGAFWKLIFLLLISLVFASCAKETELPSTSFSNDVTEVGQLSGGTDANQNALDGMEQQPADTIESQSPEDSDIPKIKVEDDETRTISLGDIDGDGTEDYIVEKPVPETGFWKWDLFYNGENIYTSEYELICDFEATLVDLDGELENQENLDDADRSEIFINIFPHVNSSPLTEITVLKHIEGIWQPLENPASFHPFAEDDFSRNAFLIKGYVGQENTAMLDITLEGAETLSIDTTSHYEKYISLYEAEGAGLDYIYEYAKELLSENSSEYKPGDLVARTSPWGIWNTSLSEYEGKNCIIATHGIESILGEKYDIIGTVDVYFNYDGDGKIKVLNMTFTEFD